MKLKTETENQSIMVVIKGLNSKKAWQIDTYLLLLKKKFKGYDLYVLLLILTIFSISQKLLAVIMSNDRVY